MSAAAPPLAITPGDPAGIGGEIVLRAAAEAGEHGWVAVADPDWLAASATALGLDLVISEWRPGQRAKPGTLPCHPVALRAPAVAGEPAPANGAYVLESLASAVALVQDGDAAALVTGPVNKAVINAGGTPFTGHTEFLAELAGVERVVMMLAADSLRVALVTTHLPLRRVPDAITGVAVRETITITATALRERFGIAAPRLQVLGLNPHAGEDGHLGHEDAEVIAPAIQACREAGLDIAGPVPADTAFTPPRLEDCDAVVAMYHDQGLPVLKHAGFGRAVNVTLGLPFVRTSVDHGTAYDIASERRADPGSLVAAARLARRLAPA